LFHEKSIRIIGSTDEKAILPSKFFAKFYLRWFFRKCCT